MRSEWIEVLFLWHDVCHPEIDNAIAASELIIRTSLPQRSF